MKHDIGKHLLAVVFSVALHALVFVLAINDPFRFPRSPDRTRAEEEILVLVVLPPPPEKNRPEPAYRALPREPAPEAVLSIGARRDSSVTTTVKQRQPASMAAPPAPSAEEWAFAARYTLKNSKGYRYTWGRQVRSLMGTAVEGPDQGMVRFRVEIAPDGTLAKLETLWTTSTVAEQLARKAIESMPPLPPTPTGKPLIFDRTIAFAPYAVDGPPIYRDDCLPDPPTFSNPFAWNGTSTQVRAEPKSAERPDPNAMDECRKQLPQDSIEAESAHDQRVLDRWGSSKLRR